jgi:hypothetical protein
LDRELNYFDRSAEPARELAKNLRNFQSARRPWERAINQSSLIVAAAALAGPAVGGMLYWLFG